MSSTTAPMKHRPAAEGGPTHRAPRRRPAPLAGLGMLIRLYGRISRRAILLWTLAFLVLVPASVVAMQDVYPDAESLQARAMLLDNPSAVMMTGPFFASDEYTFWAMVANELFLYLLLPAAIMSVLLTVRHTRAEEEAGRLEMIRALPISRFAAPLAALSIVAIANLAVGAAVVAGTLLVGGPVADSIAMGVATALTGLLFGATAAVAAQITEHSGTATGLALGLLAISFMVRGIGDVIDRQGSWLSWFSPLAWAQQTRLYVDARWWPLLLSAATALALLGVAVLLSRRRDLGAGLRAPRQGPAQASRSLLGPGGLARRLLAPGAVAWAIGLFLFAIAFGSLATSLKGLMDDISALGEWIPLDLQDLTTSFSAVILQMLALGPAGLIIAGTLRLRTEEQAGRLAGILLTGTSRAAVALSMLLVATIHAFLVQILLGIGVGLGVALATGDTAWIGRMGTASLAYLPAIAVFGGLAMVLYGLRLRLATVTWVALIWAAIVTILGELLGLPDWARGFSPLDHVPFVPDADWDAVPLLVMAGIAVALVVVGVIALRRRDLVAG